MHTLGAVTAPDVHALPVGFVLNQRYEVLVPLGRGANGVVYEVRDHHINQISALKILINYRFAMPWVEAQMLTRLEGEFILPVRNADHTLGLPFIVTEVARHGTAADQTIAGVGVPVDKSIRWVQQACRGVARIHDKRLLHNDIKPENLFISADGDAMIGDLGLATLRDATGHGAFGGTPATMAPEVAQVGATIPQAQWSVHRPTSVVSDIYSLGATLYWLLCGTPPYPPGSPINTMAAVMAGPPPDLWDIAPHVPQGVREAVNTAIARDPADRYHTAGALDAALGRRAQQKRTWTKIAPHPGHLSCFLGTGKGSDLHVCAVSTGAGSKHEIRVSYVHSGRRVGIWKVVSLPSLPRALRATFREHR